MLGKLRKEKPQTEDKSQNYNITGFITYCIGEIMLCVLAKGLATGF